MKCPICEHEMTSGYIKIKGSLLGLVIIGLSWMQLFFYPDGNKKKRIALVEPYEKKVSYYCSICKSVFITKKDINPKHPPNKK